MTLYFAAPSVGDLASLVKVENADAGYVPKPAWIPITETEYLTLSASPHGVKIVNGVPSIPAPEPIRTIRRGAFMDRFTPETQIALETLAEGQNQSARAVRYFTRRLEAETHVRLDSPALAASLAQVRTILTAANVPGWTTLGDADAAVAAILANGTEAER